MDDLYLREVVETDLPRFFSHQLEPDAVWMAAFTAKDPSDHAAFLAHWQRILADPTVRVRTIVTNGRVAGSVASYEDEGHPEVTYWIGQEFWGQGVATRSLTAFLADVDRRRPIYARVAKDNPGSRRVLEKCGFVVIGQESGFANARNEVIEELLLELT